MTTCSTALSQARRNFPVAPAPPSATVPSAEGVSIMREMKSAVLQGCSIQNGVERSGCGTCEAASAGSDRVDEANKEHIEDLDSWRPSQLAIK